MNKFKSAILFGLLCVGGQVAFSSQDSNGFDQLVGEDGFSSQAMFSLENYTDFEEPGENEFGGQAIFSAKQLPESTVYEIGNSFGETYINKMLMNKENWYKLVDEYGAVKVGTAIDTSLNDLWLYNGGAERAGVVREGYNKLCRETCYKVEAYIKKLQKGRDNLFQSYVVYERFLLTLESKEKLLKINTAVNGLYSLPVAEIPINYLKGLQEQINTLILPAAVELKPVIINKTKVLFKLKVTRIDLNSKVIYINNMPMNEQNWYKLVRKYGAWKILIVLNEALYDLKISEDTQKRERAIAIDSEFTGYYSATLNKIKTDINMLKRARDGLIKRCIIYRTAPLNKEFRIKLVRIIIGVNRLIEQCPENVPLGDIELLERQIWDFGNDMASLASWVMLE